MKFIVDQEAYELLKQLCDVALKSGGLENLKGVEVALGNVTISDQIEKMKVVEDTPIDPDVEKK
jgi:hypothetical protein